MPSIALWTRTLTSSPHSSQSPCQMSYETLLTSSSQHSYSSHRPQTHRHQTDSMLMGKLLKQVLQWLAEAGTVIGLQQTTSWWLVGNGWTKLCPGCPTDIKACCPPAYKVRILPLGWVLLQHQLCQSNNGTACFCQLSLLPWVCMAFSKMVYLWAVCCIGLSILNCFWICL